MNQDIMAETFEDMQRLIVSLALQHARRCGGDIEELISEANLIYINAMECYLPERSAVTTHLTFRITKGLLDYTKTSIKNKQRETLSRREKYDPPYGPRPFSWIEFLDDLSEDGKTIIRLIRDDEMFLQKQLRSHLRVEKWTYLRIRRGFDEIKKALAI